MKFLACNSTLVDILCLVLVASIQHDPGELWRMSLAPRAHSRSSEQKEYLYHLLQLPGYHLGWPLGIQRVAARPGLLKQIMVCCRFRLITVTTGFCVTHSLQTWPMNCFRSSRSMPFPDSKTTRQNLR